MSVILCIPCKATESISLFHSSTPTLGVLFLSFGKFDAAKKSLRRARKVASEANPYCPHEGSREPSTGTVGSSNENDKSEIGEMASQSKKFQVFVHFCPNLVFSSDLERVPQEAQVLTESLLPWYEFVIVGILADTRGLEPIRAHLRFCCYHTDR
jgi:hypothetical protein